MKRSRSNRSENKPMKVDTSKRRDFLKVAGAGLVAASVPSVAAAALTGSQKIGDGDHDSTPKPIYLYGCGWNRALPGIFGEVCLTFDVRAELGGTGVGTFRDDVNPEVNSQFQINSATKHGDVYTLEGEIIAARDPSNLGRPVTIVAESLGNGKGSASITVGTVGTSPNLVVIAIIAILIGLLLPAVEARR